MAGNLCQQVRCWYFRHPDLQCWLRGGDTCYAQIGDHRKHGLEPGDCISVAPSDLAAALLALDARVETTSGRRTFRWPSCTAVPTRTTARRWRSPGEFVTAVQVRAGARRERLRAAPESGTPGASRSPRWRPRGSEPTPDGCDRRIEPPPDAGPRRSAGGAARPRDDRAGSGGCWPAWPNRRPAACGTGTQPRERRRGPRPRSGARRAGCADRGDGGDRPRTVGCVLAEHDSGRDPRMLAAWSSPAAGARSTTSSRWAR